MNTIKIVKGCEGYSIYLNDYRIAGSKPWGGGDVVRTIKISDYELKRIKEIINKLEAKNEN